MEKEYIPSIVNFVTAVINTRHLDEQEMWNLLSDYALAKVNRMRALDPQRNR